MPERNAFDYAVVRLVPRVEREEFVNIGVILFCPVRRFLAARLITDPRELEDRCPSLDPVQLQEHLVLIPLVCAGGAGAGDLGALTEQERFHWLTAPRSTVVQTSPVHCGLCLDPRATLDKLFETTVLSPTT